jgi:arylsulfatase A-like enzyme
MYEHTVNVPLIVKGPGIPAGQRRDAQVYLRDLYPTVCELAGIPIPKTVEGRSFVPVLQGKARAIHDRIYGYFRDSQRMVRTDRWKLIRYPRLGHEQLFDLQNDPDELKDLAGEPAHQAVRDELRGRLQAWQKEVRDPIAGK